MFNLEAKNRTPGSSSRSPSPVMTHGARNPGQSSQSTTSIKRGTSPSTAKLFDLDKRAVNSHGYIPGARPRHVTPLVHAQPMPVAQPILSAQESRDAASAGGRKRSVSREHGETKQMMPTDVSISDDDIHKMIPVGSQKVGYDEIIQLLKGYVALPKKFWETELVYRQHIRYTRIKDNVFVRGGFIIGFGKQRGRATLTLANGFDPKKPGYYVWVIGLDAIAALFVKRDSGKPALPSAATQ
jgi:hypothetical protein